MIIACGVLSCVAVLAGIIALEIAVERKRRKKAEEAGENTPQSDGTVDARTEAVQKPESAPEPADSDISAEESVPEQAEAVAEDAPANGAPEEAAVAEAHTDGTAAEENAENGTDLSETADDADGDDEADADTDEGEELSSELKVVVRNGETRYIVIKYSRSFQAKLIQSADDAKRYYSELKNCLMSYGVKSRMSWKWEAFRYGRKTLARMRLRGKTLSVVLALEPEAFADTKYHVESVADVLCYVDTPCLYRIRSERRLRYAKELIAKLMQDNGLVASPLAGSIDYALQYPYETTDALIERKLIKVLTDEDAQSGEVFMPSDIRKSVKAQDVDGILRDELAVELIERLDGVSDRTKTGIINIDTLSQSFCDGETVTLDEIRKRIKGYGKTTYIKVLARGTLDKRLTVEADDFSLQAVKMIVLVGGRTIKK